MRCLRLSFVFVAGLVSLRLSSAQTVPPPNQWGTQFNSPGVTLTYKETGRASDSGKTIVTYNLYASGLPRNEHYVLCSMNIGLHPQAMTDAYIDPEGKVVNVLADPQKGIAEDPIDLKVFAARGEPLQLALVSDDDRWRVFTQIVPFPFETTAGPLSSFFAGKGAVLPICFGRGAGSQIDQ
jgi:hypothetical protein